MKISAALFSVISAAFVVACSGADPVAPDENIDQTSDRVIVEAAPKTRQTLGIAAWGIADGLKATVVRGYDGESSPVVAFEYRAAHGTTSRFEATLRADKGRATIRVEASEDFHVDVLEDSFRGNAAAQAVLARLVDDLRTQRVDAPASGMSTTLTGSTLRPLDGLVGEAPSLVNACATNLVPNGANAGQTAAACSQPLPPPECFFGVVGAPQPGAPTQCCSSATGTANRYLNRNTDELKRSGELPMDANISAYESCANFVTAVLQQSGQIGWHSNLVSDMESRLRAEGWRDVPASQAKPGDVAIIDGSSHTELVDSNNGGAITLIGSNNANADGSQRITKQAPYSKNVKYLTPPNRC